MFGRLFLCGTVFVITRVTKSFNAVVLQCNGPTAQRSYSPQDGHKICKTFKNFIL